MSGMHAEAEDAIMSLEETYLGYHRFYFTFGSSKEFPFQDGFLIVIANNIREAALKFKEKYPNREGSDCLNCSDYYTKEQWQGILKEGYYQGEQPFAVIR